MMSEYNRYILANICTISILVEYWFNIAPIWLCYRETIDEVIKAGSETYQCKQLNTYYLSIPVQHLLVSVDTKLGLYQP